MILLLLHLWCTPFAEDLLVLKNGKLINCASYQVEGQRVTITRERESFSLPVAMVDWDRTQKEVARRRVAVETRAAAEAEELARRKAERAQRQTPGQVARDAGKPIVLTDEHLGSRSSARLTEAVTIRYRKIGNSIVIPASINGRGPFDFVLDTGASVTLVSPQTVRDLNIATGPAAQVTGVGGKPVEAATAVLEELAVGGARVASLPTLVRAIEPLNAANVVGLLGQDYLDHFIMNLDSASKTLTLTPHGRPTDSRMDVAAYDVVQDATRLFDDVNQIIDQVGSATQNYLHLEAGTSTNAERRRLKQVSKQLPVLQKQVSTLFGTLREGRVELSNPETAEQFMRCYAQYDALLREIQRHTRTLNHGYGQVGKPQPLADAKEKVRSSWEGAHARAETFLGCMK